MTTSKEDPYFIEVDTIGCTQCGHGQNWNVIGPDGAALGMSYTDEDGAAEMAEMLNEAFGWGATDRDRLAERVKELEGWIDKGESPTFHEARHALLREGMARNQAEQRLATAEADNAALLDLIGDLNLNDVSYAMDERITSTLAMDHPGTALTQRLTEMEEALKEIIPVLEYYANSKAWGRVYVGSVHPTTDRLAYPVCSRAASAIQKAQQALEGKEAPHG